VWLQNAGILVSRRDVFGDAAVTVAPWTAFAAAIALTTAVAFLIGYPALRLKGHYLAMATLGFGLIVYRLLLGSEFTGGADGTTSVPPWTLAPGLVISDRTAYRIHNYYTAWGLVLLTLFCLLNLADSRFGRALRAIHGNETAANAMGVDTASHKLVAFLISAVLAAVAGCFLTHYTGGIHPLEASALHSVRYVALVAGGGMDSLWGVMAVSSLLNYLSLRGCFGSLDHAVFGTILIAIVSLAPQGPLRPAAVWVQRALAWRPRRAPPPQGPAEPAGARGPLRARVAR
jgi:branched-chain amino acid transport system permease protein